jgi:hypothetical protein
MAENPSCSRGERNRAPGRDSKTLNWLTTISTRPETSAGTRLRRRENLELDLCPIVEKALGDCFGQIDVKADEFALGVFEAKPDRRGACSNDQISSIEDALEA